MVMHATLTGTHTGGDQTGRALVVTWGCRCRRICLYRRSMFLGSFFASVHLCIDRKLATMVMHATLTGTHTGGDRTGRAVVVTCGCLCPCLLFLAFTGGCRCRRSMFFGSSFATVLPHHDRRRDAELHCPRTARTARAGVCQTGRVSVCTCPCAQPPWAVSFADADFLFPTWITRCSAHRVQVNVIHVLHVLWL